MLFININSKSIFAGYKPFTFCDISRINSRYIRLPVESQAVLTINPVIYKIGCNPEEINELTRYLYSIRNKTRHNSRTIYFNIIN